MKKNGADKMIEELGLEDCFIDAEEDFNIVPSDLANLEESIEEAIMENEANYNKGLVMIKSLGRLR